MMIVNGIYDNDFKKFFKYAKEIKEIPPIPKNFNTKHLQDFINEFDSYVILSKNVKYAKLLMDTTNKIKNIKCAV